MGLPLNTLTRNLNNKYEHEFINAVQKNDAAFYEWRNKVGNILTFNFSQNKAVACEELSSKEKKILMLQKHTQIQVKLILTDESKKIIFSLDGIDYSVDTCYSYGIIEHHGKTKKNPYTSFHCVENFIPSWFK